MSALKLCIVSSEFVPYAKTGGLADVTGALARNLRKLGHSVWAFMPLYPIVRRNHSELQPVPGVQNVALSIGAARYAFSLQLANFPGTDVAMYFVDCPALFDRAGLYTNDPDEHRRFLLFTRATLEACRRLELAPDVFHCNDWHTAFLPLFLKTQHAAGALLSHAKTLLTIHNIGYQGIFASAAMDDLMVDPASARLDQDDLAHGVINSLKTGIKFAGRVSTVSPTYAREICDTPLGMGLQPALRARPDRVVGILNGVDYKIWDPRHDAYLSAHFGPEDLSGKLINKKALIAATRLRLPASAPL